MLIAFNTYGSRARHGIPLVLAFEKDYGNQFSPD
jgi:hypothetical protein